MADTKPEQVPDDNQGKNNPEAPVRVRPRPPAQGTSGKQQPSRPSKRKPAPPPAPNGSGAGDDEVQNLGSLGAVVVRNEFYRDGYRSLLRLVLLLGVVIVGLIGAMFFVIHSHQPENRYFATTEDGRLIPMVSLMQPNLSTPALMSWVAQAATEVMTFGFNDYRRRLQESSKNFTRTGWESFTQALQQSRIIDMVETNQQVVTAAPKGAPILISEGEYNGRYQWQIQLPMIVTYQSGAKTNSTSLLVTIVVVRVPRLESSNGVGIEQWIAVPR